MARQIAFSALFQESVARAMSLIVPSSPYAALFVAASGILIWAANILPDGGSGFAVFSALTFLTLFAHSLFSVAMYHAVLPAETGKLTAAWKLTLAWLLVFVILAIAASMITLFFAQIGASLGVGTSDDAGNIADMTEQLREGGAFWPVFCLFLATLFGVFWFITRLIVFAAATASRGKVHVLRTWYWTKGKFVILAPLLLVFALVPFVALTYLGGRVGEAVFSAEPDPLEAAMATALGLIILLPSAWLSHGLAATVFVHLAPVEDQTTTPAS